MRSFVFLILLIVGIGVAYRLVIAAHGLTVTSWWRSYWHNAEVGGVKASLHQLGLAFDVLPVTDANAEFLKQIGLTVINEGDHLHAQFTF